MKTYFRFIIRHRIFVLCFLFLVTLAAGYNITRGVFSTTFGGMFFGEDPAYGRYKELATSFGNNEVTIVAIEQADPLSPKNQRRIRTAVDTIRSNPILRRFLTVLDVQHIFNQGDTLVVETYAQQALDRPDDIPQIFSELKSDPFAKGLYISEDGLHSVVIVEYKSETDLPAESAPESVKQITQAFVDAGFDRAQLHLVGPTPTLASVMDETRLNIQKIFPLVCLALLASVWIMFRRFWPVILTMIVASISVIWTMGFSVLLDRQITILASMIPPVIMIIAFSDVIHLCSAYLLELGRGKSKDDAIFASGTDVGKACFLTSITTFCGFAAMSFVPAPAFRQLGFVLGFGVAVALLIAVTAVPIFFSFMRQPKPWRMGATGTVQDLLDRVLDRLAGVSNKRPWWVISAFALLLIFMVAGLFQLKIETDFAKRLSKNHPIRVDQDYFLQHFSGSNMLDLYIKAPEKDGLLDPDLFERIARFQDVAQKHPDVTRSFSLVNLIETLHEVFTEDQQDPGRLPKTRQALAQYLLLFEMSGGEELDRLVDFSRQTMRITLQMKDEAVRQTSVIGDQMCRIAPALLEDRATVEVTGLVYLMGKWLDEILAGQRRGLLFAFFSIAILMIIGLRSFKAGLGSMVPNVLPILVLGGYLGLFWGEVDSDLLGLGMIAIGIGVDDTIHFLMRFRIESMRAADTETAIRQTFHFSGRGIIITTVILVIGFAPFALSSYLSIKVMGTLLPMTLVVALIADLLLVPALIKVGFVRFKTNK